MAAEAATKAGSAADVSAGLDWDLAARIFLAVAGCYGVAALVSMALARGLPVLGMPRSEATATGTLVGMLLWPCAIVYVFGARSVKRTALIFGGLGAVSALIAWSAGQPL